MEHQTRVAFQTLGCKLNQYESDSLATQFQRAGYRVVAFDAPAEAYVVNTCTVTSKADRKSRNSIYRAQRRATAHGHDSLVIVTGCFAGQYAQEVEAQKNTYIVGNERKNAIVQIVEAHRRGEILDQSLIEGDPFAYSPAAPVFHTRSMVKIQDGCDNFCTFCIIPYVRGRAASRSAPAVVEDVRTNLAMGYREIVLTGVNMSRYSWEGVNFSGLLERILAIEGDFRLRISSLEPDSLDDRFFALLEHPRMTPHLHLCVQSGSDKILLRMRRQYTVSEYMAVIERIRARTPSFNFTTDIIVGFPDEEEQDFAASCQLVRRAGFSHVHTFPYAVRSGTRAERMPHQLSGALKRERCSVLRELASGLKYAYRQSLVGCEQRVLVEEVEKNSAGRWWQRGYGEHYVPIVVHIPPKAREAGAQSRVNSWERVRIIDIFREKNQKNSERDGEPILVGEAL